MHRKNPATIESPSKNSPNYHRATIDESPAGKETVENHEEAKSGESAPLAAIMKEGAATRSPKYEKRED